MNEPIAETLRRMRMRMHRAEVMLATTDQAVCHCQEGGLWQGASGWARVSRSLPPAPWQTAVCIAFGEKSSLDGEH